MSASADIQAYVGNSETRSDRINANLLAAWNAMLDRDDAMPSEGDPVPPGFHWTLFPPLTRQSGLGPDGHPKKGGFLPPVALPRRMWAGSRMTFHRPLCVGERVERVSVIDGIDEKHGASGHLVFVRVRHRFSNDAGVAIEEEQDIVYRGEPPASATPTAAAPPAPAGSWRREIVPDPVLLFRYSALTFNGHRIHYDRPYATAVEGYPALVVHGPLLATLLLEQLRRHLPDQTLARFNFKALRPTFDNSPFHVDGGPEGDRGHYKLWSSDNRGMKAMEAEAWMR